MTIIYIKPAMLENDVGRKYGKKSKTRKELFDYLL